MAWECFSGFAAAGYSLWRGHPQSLYEGGLRPLAACAAACPNRIAQMPLSDGSAHPQERDRHKDSCKRRKVQGGIEHFPASFPIDRSLCPQLFFCGQSGGESIDFFNYCDYGIVGDMDEVCDAMIAQLKAR